MSVTFSVSPEVAPPKPRPAIDHVTILRKALRRPVEAMWRPTHPLVACDEDHALVMAVHDAFYEHHPLVLSPDAIWLTMARGFALHVNLNAEQLRNRFVTHSGKEKLVVMRPDFMPGRDNPWAEAFDAFSKQIGERVGKLRKFLRCDFSTTGPVELAASDLLMMDTFQAYFEYELRAGCGIPAITLTGNANDWKSIRNRAALFGEFGLETWARALDPILRQFVAAAEGKTDAAFWQSFFRYHSGSGPSVMTGWINVLFPYLKDDRDQLYPNPFLEDWERRLEIDDRQHWRQRWDDPQGVGMKAIPSALASAPVKVVWGDRETEMRFVGGLMGVSQHDEDLAFEPQCGWAVVYEEPVDPPSSRFASLEE
ncbi:MAG TPA: DUF4419 domain-containing protein [Pirellulales bacterium]|nr:DUF4419 domain-containing protein [Pirellulales bacterium]